MRWLIVVLGLLCLPAGVLAAADMQAWQAQMERRLTQLEQRVQEQDAVIREKDRQIAELRQTHREGQRDDAPSVQLPGVEIGALVEIEAGHSSPYSGRGSSDLQVATVEIGVAGKINDWVTGEIILLYEEDETPLEVDVAAVNIAPPGGPWYLVAGQQYVPFGAFATYLVSDPLTLEIAETRETAVQVGFAAQGLSGALFVFNGDNKRDNGRADRIDNWGTNLRYHRAIEDGHLAAGVAYINDIGDSNGLQDQINANLGSNDVRDHVPGWALDTELVSGSFSVIAEYTAARDHFQMAELPYRGRGARPRAWNLELGYMFALLGRDAVAAIAFQGTDEALDLGLPKRRLAAGVSVAVMENTTLSFERARDSDYGSSDGGTGGSADTATAQLGVEF